MFYHGEMVGWTGNGMVLGIYKEEGVRGRCEFFTFFTINDSDGAGVEI